MARVQHAHHEVPQYPSSTCCLAVATLLLATVAGLEAAEPGKMPDLRGTWSTTYATPTSTGRVVRDASFEITRQEGELLWGVDAWHPIDPGTGQALAEWIRAPFTGTLDPGGTGGVLASEGLRFTFRLRGPDEMELDMTSLKTLGGFAPTAFFAVLRRGAVGALPQAEWPDLSGSWRGTCSVTQPGGARPSSVRLDLVRQDGALLWMDDVWSPDGPLTKTTDPASVLRERMQGSLNSSGTGGRLAKEGVSVRFRLLAKDLMEVEYTRTLGKNEAPTAFFARLRRDDTPAEPPAPGAGNLVGTWKGAYRYALADSVVATVSSLVVTRQEGNLVWAEDVWVEPSEGDSAGTPHRDAVFGSLSPDQSHGVLAKTEASFAFRVVDGNHLEVVFTGTGAHPTAFFAVFTRQQ